MNKLSYSRQTTAVTMRDDCEYNLTDSTYYNFLPLLAHSINRKSIFTDVNELSYCRPTTAITKCDDCEYNQTDSTYYKFLPLIAHSI